MRLLWILLILLSACKPSEAAQVIVEIPDTQRDRVVAAICGQYNYQEKVKKPDGTEIPNPETKPQFTKRIIASFVKESVKAWEANQAGEAARKSAISKVEQEVAVN